MFIPLKNTVDVLVRGEPETDRFGNERPGKGVWRSVAVASWWVDRTDEKSGNSILRTIDYLHVHCRPEDAPKPDSVIRLPDGSQWQVQGNVEDYNHGWHGWAPGLVVVNAKKVEG